MHTPTTSMKTSVKWLIAFIIALFASGVYYFRQKTQTQNSEASNVYSIGQDMLLDGTLQKNANIGQYTHSMVVGSGVFGIRSKEVNLFDYTGVVTIKGSISDIIDSIPIISVTEIIGKTTIQESPFDYNQKFSYYPAMGFGINLANAKGYRIDQAEKGAISLIDTQTSDNSQVMKIMSFQCSDKDPLKDCNQLLASFSKDEQKSYKNTQGLSFYNLPETQTWIAIKEDKSMGRYLYPKSEEIFNVFINIISFYDENDIKNSAKERIAECKSSSGSLVTPQQALVTYPELRKAQVRLEGESEDSTLGVCIFDIKLDTKLEAKLLTPWETITKLSAIEKQTIGDSDVAKALSGSLQSGQQEIDNLALKPLPTSGDKVIFQQSGTKLSIVAQQSGENLENPQYIGWLKHQSVRGYSLYYSKKGIKFYGQIIDNATNLGIPGINCSYKVNISPFSSSGETNDVQVYECKGSPSPEQLSSKNLFLAGTTGSLSFLVDYTTDVLKDLKVKVE